MIEIDYIPTWKELCDHSTTRKRYCYLDIKEGNYRYLILNGSASLCAYIGIKEKFIKDDAPDDDSLYFDCHGGVTFNGKYKGIDDYLLWGWDYAHLGDYTFYYDTLPSYGRLKGNDRKWGVLDVYKELLETIPGAKLAIEKILK